MNILIIGDLESVYPFLNKQDNHFLITSKYESGMLNIHQKNSMSFIGEIETPNYFDAECFENKIETILQYTEDIMNKFHNIDRVISTHEHTIKPSALIRTQYNIVGMKLDEATNLRDKNIMKQIILNNDISTAEYNKINEDNYKKIIEEYIKNYNTIVIKPTSQAGSKEVFITNKVNEAITFIESLDLSKDYIIEEYMDYPLMNIDGIYQNGELKFLSVSKKVGNCYDYVNNRCCLGTYIINDEFMYEKAEEYILKCMKALKINSTVFHLEVFWKDDNFSFLEIAGRCPGSTINNLILKSHNLNLKELSFYIDYGLTIEEKKEKLPNNIYGMLLIPSPIKKDVKITNIRNLDVLPKSIININSIAEGEIFYFSEIDAFKALFTFYLECKNEKQILNDFEQIKINLKFDIEEKLN
ncbi:ATP-grasp domain-containing protein [Macrococcus capreoli]|uniref:ATP-grasp domain-containing protein n=1 Tax=Macrococcus capreoli TaxID=2982690 RepID=UPI003EE60554